MRDATGIALFRVRWILCVALVLLYATALGLALKRHGFDASIFICAGDRFTNEAPIRTIANSTGYDGQFYYRLAVSPLSRETRVNGVTFDHAAYRFQRIVYPVIAMLLSAGQSQWVPLALVLTNLIGLVVIWILSSKITQRLELPPLTPVVVLLWPGFIVTLLHDTGEIISAALLLAAIYFYLTERLIPFLIAATLAALARETGIVVVAGLACLEALRGRWLRAVVVSLPIVPFMAWREFVSIYWGGVQVTAPGQLDWPFVGAVQALLAARGLSRYGELFIIGVCALGVYVSAITVLRDRVDKWSLVATWLPILALMSLLSARGPWIDSTAFFRGFTECYVVACLLIATKLRVQPMLAACAASFWVAAALFQIKFMA
jgi:hypothetical protein